MFQARSHKQERTEVDWKAERSGLVSALEQALVSAQGALRAGEAAEAERSAKAISALAKAIRDVKELSATTGEAEDNVDELRAELRRRLDCFVAEAVAGAPTEVLARIASEGLPGSMARMGA
jgi:hypothetical protein